MAYGNAIEPCAAEVSELLR